MATLGPGSFCGAHSLLHAAEPERYFVIADELCTCARLEIDAFRGRFGDMHSLQNGYARSMLMPQGTGARSSRLGMRMRTHTQVGRMRTCMRTCMGGAHAHEPTAIE